MISWRQRRFDSECHDDHLKPSTERLPSEFKLVEALYNDITHVQDRLTLLTSWDGEIKQRFETLHDRLFVERYYWVCELVSQLGRNYTYDSLQSQMAVEKTYSRYIHGIMVAFDVWDIASQLNYFQRRNNKPKSILKRLSLKVGLAHDTNDEQSQSRECYEYEYVD